MRRALIPIIVMAMSTAACSNESVTVKRTAAEATKKEAAQAKHKEAAQAPAADAAAGGFPQMPAPANAQGAPVARKILYTGNIDLIVTDFNAASRGVEQLAEQNGGYISRSDIGETSGDRRHASWVLRVPVAKFRSVMDSLTGMGHPTSAKTDSQDVTDEYYDLEARLKNKQEEEKRLRDHLQKSTGKLEDILAVEREITRVRGEVESIQGRLQKLSKLAELTTISVSIHEERDYVSPGAPTFGATLGRTFSGSADTLIDFGKFLLLAIVTLVPWLPLLALLAGLIWWLRRRSHRPASADAVIPPS